MNHFPLSTWADRAEWRWPAVGIVLLVVVIGAYGLVQAGDHLDELQAVEDARIEAQQQAQQELIFRQQLQALCGGPEATVIDKPTGGHDCYDTNGRKTKTIPGLARPVTQGHESVARVFGARMQQRNFECANSFCETEPAGVVSAGSI